MKRPLEARGCALAIEISWPASSPSKISLSSVGRVVTLMRVILTVLGTEVLSSGVIDSCAYITSTMMLRKPRPV